MTVLYFVSKSIYATSRQNRICVEVPQTTQQVITSRQHDALRLEGKIRQIRVAWQHLSIDLHASQSAENQVTRLAAKVQDENCLHITLSAIHASG